MADINELQARLRVVVQQFLVEEGLLTKGEPGKVALFSALEETAVSVGDTVMREVLAEELAAQPAAEEPCPTCGAAGLRKQERQRSLQTRRGPVDVTETEHYCRRCRRSFFPSVPGAGIGRGV